MAKNLSTLYPGKITVDGNNPNGTFKNRTSDALKDGTPYEFGWTSDVWGFLSHILGLASVSPSGAEENETNSQYYDALDGLLGRRKVEFETSKDLVFNFDNSTQATATASRMSLLDSNFIPKFINDLDVTWDITADLEAGTSEKASHIYGCWIDSDEVLKLVPDLTGTTDSTSAGNLADSAATFLTDLVHDGDIVYNLTDLTQTTVSVDAAAEGTFALTDDIFVSGDDYKIVKMSPLGLGANRERLGSVDNNSGSDLDDSFYTQIQEEKEYNGDGTDFTTTSNPAITVLDRSRAYVRQANDWTGKGTWKFNFNVDYDVANAVRSTCTMTISGIITASGGGVRQGISAMSINAGSFVDFSYALTGTNLFTVSHTNVNTISYFWSGDIELDKKPTFHN